MKKTYNRPQLTVHGNVETLTEQTRVGQQLDQTLPAGTPLTVLVQNLS